MAEPVHWCLLAPPHRCCMRSHRHHSAHCASPAATLHCAECALPYRASDAVVRDPVRRLRTTRRGPHVLGQAAAKFREPSSRPSSALSPGAPRNGWPRRSRGRSRRPARGVPRTCLRVQRARACSCCHPPSLPPSLSRARAPHPCHPTVLRRPEGPLSGGGCALTSRVCVCLRSTRPATSPRAWCRQRTRPR